VRFVVWKNEVSLIKGIGKIKEEKPLKQKDVELMREWLRSGMPVDDVVAEYLEEGPYETEDSYRIKSERLSECLIEW
jgi:hypothetical protein